MANKVKKVDVYEDDRGVLRLFALDWMDHVVWACRYDTSSGFDSPYELQCSLDYAGLAFYDVDPLRRGWAGLGAEEAAREHGCALRGEAGSRRIASTDFMSAQNRLGTDLDATGAVGAGFVDGVSTWLEWKRWD